MDGNTRHNRQTDVKDAEGRSLPLRFDFLKSWAFCTFLYVGLVLVLATHTLGFNLDHTPLVRDPASLAFPLTREVENPNQVLASYMPYFHFVEAVGKKTDPEATKRLVHTFEALRKRDPNGAARFLKGLRFEMTQKLEFMGITASSVNSDTPEIRRWVGRFVKVWHREADELLFRAIAMK